MLRLSHKLTILTMAIVAGLSLLPTPQPVSALPHPSFRVLCLSSHFAPDDPIVYPGQPGASHQHTFYNNSSTNAHSTADTLKSGSSNCERNFNQPDKSAYWVPSLYKNGQEIRGQNGRMEMAGYYRRAGGPEAKTVDQPFPHGLRIIAGSPSSTGPQDMVSFKCQNNIDTGRQSKYGRSMPSCSSDENLIAEVIFPDCWDGKRLDSPDHKSHMTYSSGSNRTCPATHPVKVPELTMELVYKGVNGPANQFTLASGSTNTFHADFFAAWDPRGQAALVNECLNKAVDCNPKQFNDISQASVTQAQIDQQLVLSGQAPAATAPSATHQNHTPAAPAEEATPAEEQPAEEDHSEHEEEEYATTTDTDDSEVMAASTDSLPATGKQATFIATAGLGALGATYLVYRSSRKSLRDALLRRIGR